MHLFLTCDANWESKLDRLVMKLSGLGLRSHFENRFYGNGLDGVSIILVCRDKRWNFKRRIRHSKKEKNFYIDLIFDLDEMASIDDEQRFLTVAKKITSEIPQELVSRKLPEFDVCAFSFDLEEWLSKAKNNVTTNS